MGEILADPPEVLSNVAIGKILQWVPQLGPERVKDVLRGVVNPTVKMKDISEITRRMIVRRLAARYSRAKARGFAWPKPVEAA